MTHAGTSTPLNRAGSVSDGRSLRGRRLRFRLGQASRTSWPLAVVLILPALAFAAPVPGDTKDERIAVTVVSGEGKKIQIALMNPDGSKRTILTKGEAMEADAALSPGGKRVAFIVISKDDMMGNVWVMNSDGTERKKLTDHKAKTMAIGVSWSPDGKRLAFSTLSDLDKGPGPGNAEVIVMDADGKNAKVVAAGLLPAWSPDGKKLLYTMIDKGDKDKPLLAAMDADGKNVKQLTTTPGMMGAWSPDGKKIVYIGAPDTAKSKPHIYVSNPDGTDAMQLTKDDDKQGEIGPRWSADGKRILFNRMNFEGPGDEKVTLHVMDADGKNAKELSKGDDVNLLGGSAFFLLMRGSARAAKSPPPKP